jgi:hypothetical protein
MLRLWIDGCQRAGVKNFMVIAIDDDVARACENLGVAYWRRTPKATADKAASNHGISAQKFQLIKVRFGDSLEPPWQAAARTDTHVVRSRTPQEFLTLGYALLLSDVRALAVQGRPCGRAAAAFPAGWVLRPCSALSPHSVPSSQPAHFPALRSLMRR